jgi:hypothetical protein
MHAYIHMQSHECLRISCMHACICKHVYTHVCETFVINKTEFVNAEDLMLTVMHVYVSCAHNVYLMLTSMCMCPCSAASNTARRT